MKIVDTRGQKCPAPIIATKKALVESEPGEVFQVLTDSNVSLNNLTRYLKDNITGFDVRSEEGYWVITITTGTGKTHLTEAEEYCSADIPHFSKGDFIVVLSSAMMGEGNEELGRLLVANFIKALKNLDELPSKILFYNSGVMLGTEDSAVSADLAELEKMGVGLLFCATCVNFFSLEKKIRVGTLSNMYEIAHEMATAGKIIKP